MFSDRMRIISVTVLSFVGYYFGFTMTIVLTADFHTDLGGDTAVFHDMGCTVARLSRDFC